jgi:hypothetical protein
MVNSVKFYVIFKNEDYKIRLQTTMGQNRLSKLSLLSIESNLLRELDFSELINDFSAKKLESFRLLTLKFNFLFPIIIINMFIKY